MQSFRSPTSIAIIGLGYVGLPLAVEFSKKYAVTGFDIDRSRIADLNSGTDSTRELDRDSLLNALSADGKLKLSVDADSIRDCSVYIVTVPTPIDKNKKPDLGPLIKASELIGKYLKAGDVVIYESTTYPGCTEEDCVPVLEAVSSLVFNVDFFVGYSPERINPGDRVNTLTTIRKVTSGSTAESADFVDNLYSSIIKAGTYKAPSIKVAEASKAIENAQRDLNISFVNELALIFDRIGIDTADVIAAAATKWNFIKFQPGLVGGHCIGVDPYYLAHKSEQLGYYPQVILSGRKVNDQMGYFVATKLIKLMIARDHRIKGANVLILGITFKENCPDVRNTRVPDIYNELKAFGINVFVYDPWADPEEVKREYGIDLIPSPESGQIYDALLLTVAHGKFKDFDFTNGKKNNMVIFDTKGFLDRDLVDARL